MHRQVGPVWQFRETWGRVPIMTLSTDVERRCSNEEYLEAAYWGIKACLIVLAQANQKPHPALAIECGARLAYWQQRAIAFASR